MKFVLAKVVEKPKSDSPIVESKAIMAKSKAKGKSLPKNQRGPQVKHFCHHCGIRGHTNKCDSYTLHSYYIYPYCPQKCKETIQKKTLERFLQHTHLVREIYTS